MKSFDEYRVHLEKLEFTKKRLLEIIDELKIKRMYYNSYLSQNPHKEDYARLKIELEEQKKKLIELI